MAAASCTASNMFGLVRVACSETDGLPNPNDEKVAISTATLSDEPKWHNMYLENYIKYIKKFRWRLNLVILGMYRSYQNLIAIYRNNLGLQYLLSVCISICSYYQVIPPPIITRFVRACGSVLQWFMGYSL